MHVPGHRAVQENPIFMHLTADPNNLTAVDATLAQMKQVLLPLPSSQSVSQ